MERTGEQYSLIEVVWYSHARRIRACFRVPSLPCAVCMLGKCLLILYVARHPFSLFYVHYPFNRLDRNSKKQTKTNRHPALDLVDSPRLFGQGRKRKELLAEKGRRERKLKNKNHRNPNRRNSQPQQKNSHNLVVLPQHSPCFPQ